MRQDLVVAFEWRWDRGAPGLSSKEEAAQSLEAVRPLLLGK